MELWIALAACLGFLSLVLVARRTISASAHHVRGPLPVGDLDPNDEARTVHIDEEELIEGNWAHFLPDLQRLLSAEGVTFQPTPTRGDTIELDGVRLLEITEERPSENWPDEVIVQLARAVNRRLEAAGSLKRLYFMNGWNDLMGTFLTPSEFRTLQANGWSEELWNGDDGRPPGATFDDPPIPLNLATRRVQL